MLKCTKVIKHRNELLQDDLIILNCLQKSRSQDDRILEGADVWRKVEKGDQVICNCDPIPSNQLIALLPFLYPAVNTNPRVALSPLLTLHDAFLLLFALNASFPLFFFSILRLVSLVTWRWASPRWLKHQNSSGLYDPREAWDNNALPCSQILNCWS